MVATRALLQASEVSGTDAELRRCVRDLVGLSSLPALWIKADAGQIADSLGQLTVSMLDVEFACVRLRDPKIEAVHCHERSVATPTHLARVRESYRPNSKFEIDDANYGRLRATCVPIGTDPGSGLIALSRRSDFPTAVEQMLLQVAANQASIAIQRWSSEALVAKQTHVLQRLNETESGLYKFTDRLFRAESNGEIYEAGLDAILSILRCDRASILLFDDSNVMRFVAWRALSEEYRRAVDGHSPWRPEDRFAKAICIDDIETAGGLSEELKAVLRAERISALAFIPILAGGRVMGKFMAYYDAPHVIANREVEAGTAIARQLGFGLERLRAEITTRRLATIVETSDDAIISKTLDGVILTWNRGAERIFGYTTEEVVGKPVTILFPPERYDEEPKILARLRRGEHIDHYQTVRRRKDGGLIDVSLTVSPIRDNAGHIVAGSKIARDITAQKRAEGALRDSERRLHDLLAAIPAAIYTTDAAGKITYYNEAAVELAGRRPTIGSDDWCVTWKMYRPDGTPLPHDQCPMALALKENRAIRGEEAVAARPDGTRIPFIPFPTPLHDASGKLIGAVNMLVDIRERKQAEEALRESEERYRQLANLLPVAVYTCDASGMITYYNQQATQLWGRAPRPGDTDERFCGSEQMLLPNGQVLPHDRCPMAIALRDGSSFREEAVDIRRPDGSQISVRVNIDPIKNDAGCIVGAINVFHDVTELRRAEEVGALLVAELNHRVKNTLASVQAIAQQTLRRTRDPQQFVSGFTGRIQSLARVHSLLSAATWRSVDLHELIRDQLLQGNVDDTRVTAGGPALQLPAQTALHMAMIIHELGTNAVKYGALSSPKGWVTVTWTVEDRILRLRWQERGGPPAQVPTKRGFGTTLIEQSAKGEGGTACIIFDSDGLSWEITLPLGQLTSSSGKGQSPAEIISGPDHTYPEAIRKPNGQLAGKRFLIVEDEPLVALDLADGLADAGAEVVASVGASKEALDVIATQELDAALLDANLRGQSVDGIAAALTRRNVPFVFVSGYGRESLPRAFRDVALLNKPYSQPQLLKVAAQLFVPAADCIPLRKK